MLQKSTLKMSPLHCTARYEPNWVFHSSRFWPNTTFPTTSSLLKFS